MRYNIYICNEYKCVIQLFYFKKDLIMKKLKNEKGKKKYVIPQVRVTQMDTVRFFASSGKAPNDFEDGGYYGRESMPTNIWD